MFQTLQDVAAAIALIENVDHDHFLGQLEFVRREIEAYADSHTCFGAQIYGAGGRHRFFVRGRRGSFELFMSRHSTDACIWDLDNKGRLSREAILRAEELGVRLV